MPLLQVKEPGGPLYICQRLWPGLLQPFKDLTAGQRPLELPDELFQVMCDHPVEIDQVAVYIVEHLDVCRRPGEKYGRATGKDFNIAAMWWKPAQQQVDETALTADPGNDWSSHRMIPKKMTLLGVLVRDSRPSVNSWHHSVGT